MLARDEWVAISKALQLPTAHEVADLEGDFNMLRAVTCYLREHQAGEGISAVSNQYARHLEASVPMLRGLRIAGHPNPTLDTDRPSLPEGVSLAEHKRACKARMQRALGLQVDPEAVVVGFVGRLTYEKGADLVMHAAFWLLCEYPRVQVRAPPRRASARASACPRVPPHVRACP